MNTCYQESEKVLLNQFSVHRFYLQIIQEMEKIVTSDRKNQYFLNDWDLRTAVTFIQAIKYYMNQQTFLFQQTRDKYLHRGNPYYDIDRVPRKSKKKSSINEEKIEKSTKSKSMKEEHSNIQTIKEQIEEESLDSEFDRIVTIEEMIKMKEEGQKAKLVAAKEEAEKEIKNSFFEESESEPKSDSFEDDEEDNDAFYDRAYMKVGSIIFGNYSARALKRRPKMEDKIYLDLNNSFIKMSSNGRDAFFDRIDLQLFKIEKGDARLL